MVQPAEITAGRCIEASGAQVARRHSHTESHKDKQNGGFGRHRRFKTWRPKQEKNPAGDLNPLPMPVVHSKLICKCNDYVSERGVT